MTCTTPTKLAQRQQSACLIDQSNHKKNEEEMENTNKVLIAEVKKLEKIIESQHQHIAMIQNDLYNEQLRNENLSDLALAIDKQKARKPEDN